MEVFPERVEMWDNECNLGKRPMLHVGTIQWAGFQDGRKRKREPIPCMHSSFPLSEPT